jgi:hypothetical protein
MKRTLAAREKGDMTVYLPLEGYMRDYGCADAVRATAK